MKRIIARQTISDIREYNSFVDILGSKEAVIKKFDLSIEIVTQLTAEEGMAEIAFLN